MIPRFEFSIFKMFTYEILLFHRVCYFWLGNIFLSFCRLVGLAREWRAAIRILTGLEPPPSPPDLWCGRKQCTKHVTLAYWLPHLPNWPLPPFFINFDYTPLSNLHPYTWYYISINLITLPLLCILNLSSFISSFCTLISIFYICHVKLVALVGLYLLVVPNAIQQGPEDHIPVLHGVSPVTPLQYLIKLSHLNMLSQFCFVFSCHHLFLFTYTYNRI